MEPIGQMLLPEERVLYEAHVHPIVLAPGFAGVGLATFFTYFFWNISPKAGFLMEVGRMFDAFFLRYIFIRAHQIIALHPETVRAIILCIILFSAIRLAKGFLKIFFTNLVITSDRIILRQGVFNISLVEIDRRRVASVMIFQTYTGRYLGYGNLVIQGFAASIYGLPVLSNPQDIQKHIYAKD